MKDTIIKGDGTSRRLRAPADMPNTYAEWRQQVINGDATMDIVLDENGVDVMGTPLNKSTLLSDSTKTAIGLLQEDPTIDNALFTLGQKHAGYMGLEASSSEGVTIKAVPGVGAYDSAFANGRWVRIIELGGYGNASYLQIVPQIFISFDLRSWSYCGTVFSYGGTATYYRYTYKIKSLNGRFIIYGGWASGNDSKYPFLMSSTDGLMWTAHNVSGMGYIDDIVFGNGVYLAKNYSKSSQQSLHYSTNLNTWTQGRYSTYGFSNLTYALGRFIVKESSSVVTSTNGSSWSTTSGWPTTAYYECNGNLFAFDGTTMSVSTTYNTWSTYTVPETMNTSTGSNILYAQGHYLIPTRGKIMYSETPSGPWSTVNYPYSANTTSYPCSLYETNDGIAIVSDQGHVAYLWFNLNRDVFVQNSANVTNRVRNALKISELLNENDET